jgi:hypothetical protein
MSEKLDPNWRSDLEKMTPEEKRAYLKVLLRLRVHCPRCPVKHPRLDRDPCYSCTTLPGDMGRITQTVN